MPRPAIHNRLGNLKQENPMNVNHYIGFDVHFSAHSRSARCVAREPWHGAMEATLFSGWIHGRPPLSLHSRW